MNRKENILKFSLNGLTPTRISKFAIKKLLGELRTAALPRSERGRHSLLLYGDEGPQGSSHLAKVAFTLAEVLITLGIIGVVAAMTLPTLIQNYKKHVVETRLAKFYSVMNEAFRMSETVNGDKKYWDPLGSRFELDEDDNEDKTKSIPMAWYNKYLKAYLNGVKTDVDPIDGRAMIYFNDGSLCLLSSSSVHFYPSAKDYKNFVEQDGKVYNPKEISGIKYFTFYIPQPGDARAIYKDKGIEPYKGMSWDGKKESLYNNPSIGCNENATTERAYCTAIIQLNGWKIPKDYPFKF